MALSPVAQWVSQVIAKSDSGAELARQLTRRLRRNIDRAAVSKMAKDERDVLAEEMLAMEELTGLPVPSQHVPILVPVIDWVAAGTASEPMSQLPESDAPPIALADLGRGDFFALNVKGNSMDRLVPEGAVIVVNRADKDPISGKPYVFSLRGETTFKLWNADPVYLRPHSWDGSHGPTFIKRKRDLVIVGRVVRAVIDLR